MTSSYVRDYLERGDFELQSYTCGKIDNEKEKALCVYLLTKGTGQTMAVGGRELTTFDKDFSVLIRGGKNYTKAELLASSVYDYITELKNKEADAFYVYYTEMSNPHPLPMGSDDRGVYEFVIEFKTYYKK